MQSIKLRLAIKKAKIFWVEYKFDEQNTFAGPLGIVAFQVIPTFFTLLLGT